MLRKLSVFVSLVGACAAITTAHADETDQFLTWNIELADSAGPINAYLNDEIRAYLDELNAEDGPSCDCPDVTLGVFQYLFRGRLTARMKDFYRTSEDIDVYPPRSVSNLEYNRMSIYRGVAFPFILPMAPTLRIGDVYLGDDKLGHFFGFGRRYYRRYLSYLERGLDEEEAVYRVIRRGVMSENTVVGAGVDGIFSHGDLEANYQGFELARRLCGGENPYIAREDSTWQLVREIDLRDYVNPYFDESYNPSHFWRQRRELTLARIRELYAHRAENPIVMERFRRYSEYSPSPSVQVVREYFLERGRSPQADQVFAALDLPPDYPIAILASVPVP